MINPQELRIGNYFYRINRSRQVHLPDGEVLKVLRISLFGAEYCNADENPMTINHDFYKVDLRDISPIRLTPQWLERASFRNNSKGLFTMGNADTTLCVQDRSFIGFTDNTFSIGIRYDDWDQDPVTINNFAFNIKYVHELQNIWPFLTNEELTFKPS